MSYNFENNFLIIEKKPMNNKFKKSLRPISNERDKMGEWVREFG